jgi:hypothetical protein
MNGNGRKIVQHTNGSYIICNSATNQIEQRGVINPNPDPYAEYQHHQLQKGSEQNRRSNNSYALEMYGLVNKITGREDIYDNIQTMAAYPQYHRYQMASEQQQQQNSSRRANNAAALEFYHLVQRISNAYSYNIQND